MRRLFCSENGAVAVEFALLGWLVLFFILGIIDIGRYEMAADALESGVKRAARVGMVSSIESDTPASAASLQAIVDAAILSGELPEVEVTWTNNRNAVGETVTVTAVQDFKYLTPFLSDLGVDNISRTASAPIVN